MRFEVGLVVDHNLVGAIFLGFINLLVIITIARHCFLIIKIQYQIGAIKLIALMV